MPFTVICAPQPPTMVGCQTEMILTFGTIPRYLNYQRLLAVLENLGLDLTDVRREGTFNLKQSFFRHHFEDFTIDFIPKIGGDLSFSECNKRRHAVPIGEIEVFILSLTDLIISKKATGRKKDLHDV